MLILLCSSRVVPSFSIILYGFGGFQGCVRYKENPLAIMYTQEEADKMFAVFPPVDVFITHCPLAG